QKKLKNEVYDLVLLDLNLPDSQGLDTVISIMDHTENVPVIVLSGLDDQDLAIQAVQLGAQDYVIKGHQLEAMLMRSIRYAMERHRLYLLQREMALRDDLTGLYNRRGLKLLAEPQFKLAERRGENLSLLLADIDRMKEINDIYGHIVGDEALRDVARVMRLTFRTSDVLARLGGDEFAVLAVDTNLGSDDRLIERWQNTLTRFLEGKDRPYLLSISIGARTFSPEDEFDLERMIADADQAMYRIKNGGPEARQTAHD
ncbi:MAG: diguanylate cyclase, partial [Anaerolineales bacterium]